jgi:hypothetical protein
VHYRKDDRIVEINGKLDGIESDILTFITKGGETHKISFNEIIESIEELPW